MKDKESKIKGIEVSHTLGGDVIHTWFRQSRGLRQTMPVWVTIRGLLLLIDKVKAK